MFERSRPLSSSGLRLLLRLLSVLAAFAVLSVSARASAAPLAAVPMCGERNESVAAPPIFRAVDLSSLRGLPCQAPEQLGVGQRAPVPPERSTIPDAPDRVLPFLALGIAQGESGRLMIPSGGFTLERPGFIPLPFRPPRA